MAIHIPLISEFNDKGITKAISQFEKLQTTAERAQFAIRKAAVPATAALAGLAVAAASFAKAAADEQQQQVLLATQLKNSTGATAEQSAAIDKQLTAMSRVVAVADDQLRPAFAALVQGTHSVSKAQGLMSVTLDTARATGKTAADVAMALSRAYDGNYKGLKSLSPELAKMIKDHASFNDVVKVLEKNYGGMNKAFADSASGGFAKMQIALNEAKESIGSALLPAVQAMASALTLFGNWAEKNKTLILALGAAFAAIAIAIVAGNVALNAWKVAAALAAAANAVLATSITAVDVATGGIIIAIGIAATAFLTLSGNTDIATTASNNYSQALYTQGKAQMEAVRQLALSDPAFTKYLSFTKELGFSSKDLSKYLADPTGPLNKLASYIKIAGTTGLDASNSVGILGQKFVDTAKKLGLGKKDFAAIGDVLLSLEGSSIAYADSLKALKNLGINPADNSGVNASTVAKKKAAAAAKLLAEQDRLTAEASDNLQKITEKLKQSINDAAQALRDKLNAQLDKASTALDEATKKFTNFSDSVGSAVTASFNFGDAQSTAAGNSEELKTALQKQADAQAKVNKAQADFNYFQRDDYAATLADAMGELAVATNEVSAAQSKPLTFFDGLQKQSDKAKKFGELLSRLLLTPLSKEAYDQVVAAGVDGGTAIAEELLASADNVLKANKLTEGMTKLAKDLGDKSAAKWYQTGVDTATSFLKGIQDTIKNVEVVLGNPNVTLTDISNADLGITTPVDLANFEAIINAALQGMNFNPGVSGVALASGGITTGPVHALVGESGPEAIIPLDRLGSMGFGGNGGGITVNVNGGDPNAVVQALRTYMRQNGSIPVRTSNLY